MRQKWCELVARVCFWALKKVGCRVPVVRPVTVDIRDCQRVRCQEIIDYHQMAMMTVPGSQIMKDMARRKVAEAVAAKVAELAEVYEEPTEYGLRYRADILATNYPIIPEP